MINSIFYFTFFLYRFCLNTVSHPNMVCHQCALTTDPDASQRRVLIPFHLRHKRRVLALQRLVNRRQEGCQPASRVVYKRCRALQYSNSNTSDEECVLIKPKKIARISPPPMLTATPAPGLPTPIPAKITPMLLPLQDVDATPFPSQSLTPRRRQRRSRSKRTGRSRPANRMHHDSIFHSRGILSGDMVDPFHLQSSQIRLEQPLNLSLHPPRDTGTQLSQRIISADVAGAGYSESSSTPNGAGTCSIESNSPSTSFTPLSKSFTLQSKDGRNKWQLPGPDSLRTDMHTMRMRTSSEKWARSDFAQVYTGEMYQKPSVSSSFVPPPTRPDEILLADYMQHRYVTRQMQHTTPAEAEAESERCKMCGDIFCFCTLDITIQTDNDHSECVEDGEKQ